MFNKMKALENENYELRRKLKKGRFVFLIIGFIIGKCVHVSVQKLGSGDIKDYLGKVIYKEDEEEIDQETLEVLEEEKDDFE